MPTRDISPESEARWQAWLAKGLDRERRRNHGIKIVLMVLAGGAAVVASISLALL